MHGIVVAKDCDNERETTINERIFYQKFRSSEVPSRSFLLSLSFIYHLFIRWNQNMYGLRYFASTHTEWHQTKNSDQLTTVKNLMKGHQKSLHRK